METSKLNMDGYYAIPKKEFDRLHDACDYWRLRAQYWEDHAETEQRLQQRIAQLTEDRDYWKGRAEYWYERRPVEHLPHPIDRDVDDTGQAREGE